jgi:glyoxylase I family protein
MSEVGSWEAWSGLPARGMSAPPSRPTKSLRTAVRREIQQEIRALETRLTNPPPGEGRAVALLVADDFREFASTGRIYGADALRTALTRVGPSGVSRAPVSLEGFRVERVAPNAVLATYLARQAAEPGSKPPSLRSSLWCKRDGEWRIVFHQGTPVAYPDRPVA